MPPKSKSNRHKSKKPVKVQKQRWQVKQPTRNWLELPTDITANILSRIGAFDILENAQKVCTTWRKICKDPAMWRVIHMENPSDPCARPSLQKMCMNAVDRSQGQLVDIRIVDFGDDGLLLYVANRSSQLRRLHIACCYGSIYDSWPEALQRFPLLEELSLHFTDISKEAIEAAGRYCPMLKTLKVNQRGFRHWDVDTDDESIAIYNEDAVAIGDNLPELRHLELIGNSMTNVGLQAIVDGCRRLESLDLRCCWNVNLDECEYSYDDVSDGCEYSYDDVSDVFTELFLDDVVGYSDYDDFTRAAYIDDYNDDFDEDLIALEGLNEMMILKAMFG